MAGLDAVTVLELVECYGPLTLEAEFEDDHGIGHPENLRLDDLPFTEVAHGHGVLGEQRLEVGGRDVELFFAVRIRVEFRRDPVGAERHSNHGGAVRLGRIHLGFGLGYVGKVGCCGFFDDGVGAGN